MHMIHHDGKHVKRIWGCERFGQATELCDVIGNMVLLNDCVLAYCPYCGKPVSIRKCTYGELCV